MNDREHALWNITFVNVSWVWTLCCSVTPSTWDSSCPQVDLLGILGSWRTEGTRHTHTIHEQTYTSNINRLLTRNSCAELFSERLSSWNQQDWVGMSSNVPHEAFLRLCRRARTRSGKWGNGMAHPVLSVSVPADSPLLLTLAKLHTFIYVTFRQRAAWSTLLLTEKKYKSDLTKEKRNHRHLQGNNKDIIYYFTWPLSGSG